MGNTPESPDLLPEVDVENFSGEVEVDVGVVGIIPSVGDSHIQGNVTHSTKSQMRSNIESGRDIKGNSM